MRILYCACAGLILSACTVGPTYQPPEMDLPDRYSLLAPVSKASRADLHWWLDFNDPVLTRLVDTGMQDNLSVAQARERVREAEAALRRDSVAVTGDLTASARERAPRVLRLGVSALGVSLYDTRGLPQRGGGAAPAAPPLARRGS